MKEPYELNNGPVNSPEKYVDFCIYQGRQTGKTHKLLMSLPNKPLFLVVHRQHWGKEMLRIIKHHRPDYDVKNINLISYDPSGKYIEKLRGKGIPIYYDNCVLDMIQMDYVRLMNNLFGERQ